MYSVPEDQLLQFTTAMFIFVSQTKITNNNQIYPTI